MNQSVIHAPKRSYGHSIPAQAAQEFHSNTGMLSPKLPSNDDGTSGSRQRTTSQDAAGANEEAFSRKRRKTQVSKGDRDFTI